MFVTVYRAYRVLPWIPYQTYITPCNTCLLEHVNNMEPNSKQHPVCKPSILYRELPWIRYPTYITHWNTCLWNMLIICCLIQSNTRHDNSIMCFLVPHVDDIIMNHVLFNHALVLTTPVITNHRALPYTNSTHSLVIRTTQKSTEISTGNKHVIPIYAYNTTHVHHHMFTDGPCIASDLC